MTRRSRRHRANGRRRARRASRPSAANTLGRRGRPGERQVAPFGARRVGLDGLGHLRDRRDARDRLPWETTRGSRTRRRAAGRRCTPGCRSCPGSRRCSRADRPRAARGSSRAAGPMTLCRTPRMLTRILRGCRPGTPCGRRRPCRARTSSIGKKADGWRPARRAARRATEHAASVSSNDASHECDPLESGYNTPQSARHLTGRAGSVTLRTASDMTVLPASFGRPRRPLVVLVVVCADG